MVAILKVVGLMSCGILLCLGLADIAQVGHAAEAVQTASPADPVVRKGGHRLEGDVLRVEGEYYFVMGQDEKEEVRVHTDRSTKKIGSFSQGNRIVANVNDQNHARWIRLADMADMIDRRYDNVDRTTDSTVESGKTNSVGQSVAREVLLGGGELR